MDSLEMTLPEQLVSYIAPAAPATRRPAAGDEAFLRPEVGFTPQWFREALGIDFGERWHTDLVYRRESVLAMRAELRRHFPNSAIGGVDRSDTPLDLLTGVHGACTVAAIYGVPTIYRDKHWPVSAGQYLNEDAVERLQPPDLDSNAFFQGLMSQVDEIAKLEGRVEGYINWQGVLNNAHRLRGEALFTDLLMEPERCLGLFDCVCTTMIEGARRLHARQRESGVEVRFFTVSNCLVNLVSPEIYRDLLLPFDRRIAESFDCIGIHNCAWNANPYMEAYAQVPDVGYIDMGIDSDLARARDLMPEARRAIMYTPMDLRDKAEEAIRQDLERIASEYGPCDIVAADIEAGTPDTRVHFLSDCCARISAEYE